MYFSKEDIRARRTRLSQKWDQLLKEDEAVLIYSGRPVQKPGGLDQNYPFLPHPSYYWLTARRREEEVLLYNKTTGWIEFQQTLSPELAVWEGPKQDLLVSEPGKDISQLKDYLTSQRYTAVYELGQSGKPLEGKAFELRTALDQTRRIKDEAEVRLIKQIAQIAAGGYEAIQRVLQPGISEKEVQLAFETQIYRQGAHTVPYDTIVGSGANAAILHALPTFKIIEKGELVLVDAGADIYDYCVDITRTYASSQDIDHRQKALYSLVSKAQRECMALSKPGVYWRDVHAKAATLFTEGLLELGILKGSLSDLVEKEVVSLFFPHGLGHLVGLRVRDTGQEENIAPKSYFGSRLRVDLQLEAGQLITAEPGLYFIGALLENPRHTGKYKDDIDWAELEHWKNIGGVRIEDNILITDDGNENLTACIAKAAEL